MNEQSITIDEAYMDNDSNDKKNPIVIIGDDSIHPQAASIASNDLVLVSDSTIDEGNVTKIPKKSYDESVIDTNEIIRANRLHIYSRLRAITDEANKNLEKQRVLGIKVRKWKKALSVLRKGSDAYTNAKTNMLELNDEIVRLRVKHARITSEAIELNLQKARLNEST